jgi:hypothetical protein
MSHYGKTFLQDVTKMESELDLSGLQMPQISALAVW